MIRLIFRVMIFLCPAFTECDLLSALVIFYSCRCLNCMFVSAGIYEGV